MDKIKEYNINLKIWLELLIIFFNYLTGKTPLCNGKLTKAWGLGGLLKAHSKLG